MKTVWKYPIPLEDVFTLQMPVGATPLTVMLQNGAPHLWALIDPQANLETCSFRLAGTGHGLQERNLLYVGSFQLEARGFLVFHLFQELYK